jgi:hypothetical protein
MARQAGSTGKSEDGEHRSAAAETLAESTALSNQDITFARFAPPGGFALRADRVRGLSGVV